jgi:hypothetical protein
MRVKYIIYQNILFHTTIGGNKMSKDQIIGVAILIICVVVALGYLVTLFYPT